MCGVTDASVNSRTKILTPSHVVDLFSASYTVVLCGEPVQVCDVYSAQHAGNVYVRLCYRVGTFFQGRSGQLLNFCKHSYWRRKTFGFVLLDGVRRDVHVDSCWPSGTLYGSSQTLLQSVTESRRPFLPIAAAVDDAGDRSVCSVRWRVSVIRVLQ
jgi:hypothetical protein